MHFSSSQDKDDMWRGFFERLKQGVESGLGEHMDFIDDVNLVSGYSWGEIDLLPEVSDLVNATIGGSIDLYQIKSATFIYRLAHATGIAGLTATIVQTINCFGQDAPGAGLACASGTGEKVRMTHPPCCQGVEQRPGYLLLAQHIG